MKKWILLAVSMLLVSCAGPHIKYEKQVFTPPPKSEAYKMPVDPFVNIPLPVPVYLKKDTTGKWESCPAEQAELAAYTTKDLNNITIRIVYYRGLNSTLENQINLHIYRENQLIDLVVDMNILKELIREWNVDLQNKITSDKNWAGVEKGSYMAIILGLIIEMGILALH